MLAIVATPVEQTSAWLNMASSGGTQTWCCQCLNNVLRKQRHGTPVPHLSSSFAGHQLTAGSAECSPRILSGGARIHRLSIGSAGRLPPLLLSSRGLQKRRISGEVMASLVSAETGLGDPVETTSVPLPSEGPNAAPVWVRKAVADQPWRGGLEPCGNHSYTVDPAAIDGQIPEELRGTIYRCGPGRIRIGSKPYGHWFDGDGMVYALKLDGPSGPVHFTSRWVETERFKAQEQAGPETLITKGAWTTPEGLLHRVGLPQNPSNTSIISFQGRMLALCEGGSSMEVDPTTLATLGPRTFGLESTFSAHPKIDPKTGVLYNHGLFTNPMAGSFAIGMVAISPDGKVLRSEPIQQPQPSFVHDTAMSENYCFIAVPPYSSSPLSMVKSVLGLAELGHTQRYDASRGTRIVVLAKKDLSVVHETVVEAFSTYHFGNAYEEGGKLHVHVNVLNGPRESLEANFSNMYAASWDPPNQHTLYDLVWDMATWQLLSKEPAVTPAPDVQPPYGMEFPQFNQKYAGQKHRYTYVAALQTEEEDEDWRARQALGQTGAGNGGSKAADNGAANGAGNGVVRGSRESRGKGRYLNCLQKYDHETGQIKTFQVPGQFVADTDFIPRAGATQEDDGYLVSFLYEPARHGTNVVILDAKTFDPQPVATIRLPTHVPFYFHGCWAGNTA